MAGIITNVIKTLFTTSGASDVEADVNRLGRAQTRLGNASVGTGRQFAAQASGMGGLVAAYAGAAATAFALGAAFDALSRSARAMQTIEGVNTLAADIAQSGPAILKSLKDITNGQLTMAATAEQVNLALTAGFNTSQIEGLATVATKASRALGRDLADSMTRVVRGSAKMEAELLDELGIYTKIDPATRAYAAAIGKTVSSLSEYERRQAFVNAVIAEGERKFKSINTTIPTSAQQIEALGATLTDMATKLGGLLADLLAPLATGIVENATAAFGALGVVLSLIASKSVSLFSASMKALVADMQANVIANENLWRARLKLTDIVLAATNANKALADSVIRLNSAEAASFGKIRDVAASRGLTRKEMTESNKLLKTNLGLLNAEREQLKSTSAQKRADYQATLQAKAAAKASVTAARAMPQGGGFGTPDFIARTRAINIANGALRQATAAEQALKPAIDATRASLTANMAAIVANTKAIQANAAATMGWRAVLAGAGAAVSAPFIKSIGNIGAVFGAISGFVAKAFFWISIIQLIGTTLANAFGKGAEYQAFFAELGNSISTIISGTKTKQLKSTLLGITGSALSDIEAVNSKIRNVEGFTFKKKSFLGVEIEITKTKEELTKEVSSLLMEVGNTAGKSFSDSLTSSLALSGAATGAIVGSFFTPIGTAIGAGLGLVAGAIADSLMNEDKIDAAVKEFGQNIVNKFRVELAQLPVEAQEAAVKALAVIESRYSDKALVDPAARAAKALQEDLIFRSIKFIGVTASIGQIMAATAKSADEVTKAFSDFTPAVAGISYLQDAITNLGNTKIGFRFIDDMDAGLNALLDTVITTGNALKSNILTAVGDTSNVAEGYTYDVNTASVDAAATSLAERIDLAMRSNIDPTVIQERLAAGIDPLSPGIRSNLTNLETAVFDAFKGMDFRDILNVDVAGSLRSSFELLEGPLNAAQSGLLLTTNVLQGTMSEINKGSITLERFGQNTDNVRDSLIGVAKDLALAEASLPALQADVAKFSIAGTAEQQAAAANLLAVEESRVANLRYILDVNRQTLDYLLSQEDSLKKQVELTAFLKDQGKGVMSDIAFNFEIAKASSESAATAAASYFSNLISGNKAASAAADIYQDRVSAAFAANKGIADNISTAARQAIQSASTERLTDVAAQLKDVQGVTVDTVNGIIRVGTTIVPVVSQASQDALTLVTMSSDAMKKIAQDSFLEAINLTKKLGETIASTILDVEKELRTIEQDKFTAKIQFDIDKLNISMTAAKAAREFNIALLENQIKMTELKVDLKKVKPVEGASQINSFESKILAERRALIEDERRISQEIYDKEIVAAIDKNAREKEKIDLETKAKIDAITREYNLLRDVIITYNSVSSQLETAIITGGNTMGQTIVTALNTGAQAFVSSLGPIAAALGITAKPGTFTPAAVPSTKAVGYTAGQVVTATEVQIGKDLAPILAGVQTATTALNTLGEEQISYASDSLNMELDLMGKKRIAAEAEFDRQVALLAQQENISKLEAEKRLKAAAGGDDKEKARLTGRLAELQSSINSSVESAFMSLNTLITTGKGSIKEIIGSLFMSIQEEVFKKTIATPLSNIISNWVTGGIQQVFGNKDIMGSSLEGVVGSAVGAKGKDLLKNPMGDKAVDAGVEAFKNIGTKINGAVASTASALNGAAVSGAAAISGTATTLATTTTTSTGVVATANTAGATTLMSSLGPILAVLAVIAAIVAIFGGKKKNNSSASLASVTSKTVVPSNSSFSEVPQMASGGLLRDRLPTLLEPGEFVIRRPAVNRIGVNNLAQMNATGKNTNNSAPVINIKNEGTQKDAQASPPRFDGEKYVIDIIMRDLSNNGPVRRTLRGGAF